ncbi:aspartate-semialdehyde dehydrogenase [Streptomyces clavuligerus]|uniref:Aspartate-semialdehyde dehydrogenase n=1 Tax=Streptomyces clavuligerus TaxID=1901 RepID=B5H3B3_STRCL|nr:aspartate-semialdehyde dehydrogenase [Streptomyces clavuligerus]ANW19511.1 aspartate-semialdehyde dehydrogenase [Streptomyces clavuligerus]AXU14118.1 aspartate-semialdehyde dehydrogenase [Streptomyces clavuligerus]EDY53059.1 aspartate-semialdehyde dehydrogenase [Streptomyces clavuligerus]EFG07685.1 Aspartate-semialdehyde dehydrogenase [Streptomyces clavuligerus]MBY6304107.1 aspartate-semialdehyde dehydrogenase [Streptomyces clavuligerus]
MTRKPALAVVGATGAAGSELLQILTRHEDVWGGIRLIASPRSAGRVLSVRGEECAVLALDEDALAGVDLALFLTPGEVSARWAPVAVSRGAVVVDSSDAFRLDPDVPLVVPELNPHAARLRPRGIVASPHDTTLTLLPAVGALHAAFGLRELVLSSYQAASGAGRAAVAALREQLALVAGTELGTATGDVRRAVGEGRLGPLPAPLALNVVPWTGAVRSDGWSSEELGLREETRKVLGLPALKVAATCVRVPVLTAHSLTVHARFEDEVTVAKAHEVLATSPGVVLYDEPALGDFPTPADVVGTDPTWAGRVRRAPDDPCALELFLCADNLRQGTALNSARIAELIAAEFPR